MIDVRVATAVSFRQSKRKDNAFTESAHVPALKLKTRRLVANPKYSLEETY